jgi:hypothetical protein
MCGICFHLEIWGLASSPQILNSKPSCTIWHYFIDPMLSLFSLTDDTMGNEKAAPVVAKEKEAEKDTKCV